MKKFDKIELFQEWCTFLLNKGIRVKYAHLASMDKQRVSEIHYLHFLFVHGWELSVQYPEHYKTFQAIRRLKGKPHELKI